MLPSHVNEVLPNSRDGAEEPAEDGERARNILDSIGDAVACIDLRGHITYLNVVAEKLTGWSRHDACGRPLPEVLRIVDEQSREPAPSPLTLALANDRPAGLSTNSVLIGRDGCEFAVEDTATPIHDRSGQVVGAVMVFRDVSAARARSLQMSHLAHHDSLTGLPNRLLLHERLLQTLASARRHRRSLAVMFLDMDGFKRVNDSLGHTAGDLLLQSISRRLVGCVRDSDTVSRLGGDEFVVLLAELGRPESAAHVAGKIMVEAGSPHRIGPHCLAAPLSMGIGVYPSDGADADTLMKNADTALLRAKARGGGTFQFYGEHPGRDAGVAPGARQRGRASVLPSPG